MPDNEVVQPASNESEQAPSVDEKPIKRTKTGLFLPGTKPGPGNPYAKKIHMYRRAIYAAVKPKDFREIIQAMVRAARGGDVAAAKFVKESLVGKEKIQVEMNTPLKLYDIGGDVADCV